MRYQHPSFLKRVFAGGAMLLALGLLIDFQSLPSFGSKKTAGEPCQGQEASRSQAKLSREQLAKLLTVSEGNKKERVREITKEPYCKLAALQVRAGATAQREAYPLEFDPQTWIVLLYEGDQYAGYRFTFH